MKIIKLEACSLRIPRDLKDWVRNRAFVNRRSINAEMNVIIEIAKEAIEEKEIEKARI